MVTVQSEPLLLSCQRPKQELPSGETLSSSLMCWLVGALIISLSFNGELSLDFRILRGSSSRLPPVLLPGFPLVSIGNKEM